MDIVQNSNKLIQCPPRVVFARVQAICQAHQLMPHYFQIAAPTYYYAILSVKAKEGLVILYSRW